MRTGRLLVAAALALGGCGLPDQVRKDSETLALLVDSVAQQTAAFKKGRDAIDQARLRNTTAIEDSALRAEQRVLLQKTEWEVTQSKDRIALYEGIRVGVEKITQQRRELVAARAAAAKEVTNAKSAVGFRQDKLSESSAALAKLAEGKDAKEEFAFYKDFFKQVGRNLKDAKTKADSASASAKSKTETKNGEKDD